MDKLSEIRGRLEDSSLGGLNEMIVYEVIKNEDYQLRLPDQETLIATATSKPDAMFIAHCPDDIKYLLERVEALEAAKNGAYSERNKLVAAISKLFPSSLERHPEDDKAWEDDWRWIVFINLPSGQVSWHIHDSELPSFDHLFRICGRKWDGHTNDEKYARLAALEKQP